MYSILYINVHIHMYINVYCKTQMIIYTNTLSLFSKQLFEDTTGVYIFLFGLAKIWPNIMLGKKNY